MEITTSGYNMPPGCFEGDPRAPWNRDILLCGECDEFATDDGETGVCSRAWMQAYDSADVDGVSDLSRAVYLREWVLANLRGCENDCVMR